MFETVRPVAPPTRVITDVDLDRIERDVGYELPVDYRAFLTTFGPGTLDQETHIWAPSQVVDQTPELRAMYREPDGDERGRLYWYFANAVDLLVPADIDRLVFIGASDDGDDFAILPGDPPRYVELPRHRDEVGDGGTTMENFLVYLDPRTRYDPQARRIVEGGVARDIDGRPDGTPYIHPFRPEGYKPPEDDRPWIERQITWGHGDDGLVNKSLHRIDIGQRPTDITFHMKQYPLLALLEAIALRDPSARFKTEESDTPNAGLTIPRYDATLHAGPGMRGLTLYVRVLQAKAPELFRWLTTEIRALGHEAPPSLLAQAPE